MPNLILYRTDKGTFITDNSHNILYASSDELDTRTYQVLSGLSDDGRLPFTPEEPLPSRSRAFLRERASRDRCEVISEGTNPFLEILSSKEITLEEYRHALTVVEKLRDARVRVRESIDEERDRGIKRIADVEYRNAKRNDEEYRRALRRLKARYDKSIGDLGPEPTIEDFL